MLAYSHHFDKHDLTEAHGRSGLLNERYFRVLKKCQSKFDCLVFEILCIKRLKPNLNVQADSIRAELSFTFTTIQARPLYEAYVLGSVSSDPTLLNRAATTPGTSCPTLFDKCGGSLTSHRIFFRVEGIVRRDLRLIVLIREDLKV